MFLRFKFKILQNAFKAKNAKQTLKDSLVSFAYASVKTLKTRLGAGGRLCLFSIFVLLLVTEFGPNMRKSLLLALSFRLGSTFSLQLNKFTELLIVLASFGR